MRQLLMLAAAVLLVVGFAPQCVADDEGESRVVKIRYLATESITSSMEINGPKRYLTFLGGKITGVFESNIADPAPTVSLSFDGNRPVLTYASPPQFSVGYVIAYTRCWSPDWFICEPCCADCGCFYGHGASAVNPGDLKTISSPD